MKPPAPAPSAAEPPSAGAPSAAEPPAAGVPSAAEPPAAGIPPALMWSADNCTVARAMAVIGDKWTLVVLREIFCGIRRFDQMRVRTGIPRQVLANRLDRLVGDGILRRQPYREEGLRARTEYRLTDMGLDLYPVLTAILAWGNRYLADPEGSPIELVHRDCGAQVRAPLRCAAGHEVGSPRDVVPRPGPGARPRT